jgi:hypothetical protein
MHTSIGSLSFHQAASISFRVQLSQNTTHHTYFTQKVCILPGLYCEHLIPCKFRALANRELCETQNLTYISANFEILLTHLLLCKFRNLRAPANREILLARRRRCETQNLAYASANFEILLTRSRLCEMQNLSASFEILLTSVQIKKSRTSKKSYLLARASMKCKILLTILLTRSRLYEMRNLTYISANIEILHTSL